MYDPFHDTASIQTTFTKVGGVHLSHATSEWWNTIRSGEAADDRVRMDPIAEWLKGGVSKVR